MALEVHAFDLVSNDQLGVLDVGRLRWSERLNGRMELTGRLDLASTVNAERAASMLPGRTKLVLLDGPIVQAFIVWETRYVERRFLELRCAGLWSWFQQRPIDARRVYNQVDQHTIAADLVSWSQTSGGIGVTVDDTLSGVLRDRTYEAFELASVGQCVDELAEVDNGFDHAIISTWLGDRSDDVWTPSFPRAGRSWPDSGIQIDADGEAVVLTLTTVAPLNRMIGVGEGEGADMLRQTATLSLDGYPFLFGETRRKSIKKESTLLNRTTEDMARHNRRIETFEATVVDRHATLQGLIVGDECNLAIGMGDYLHPDGLDVVRRVIGRSVTISDDGGPDHVGLELEVPD